MSQNKAVVTTVTSSSPTDGAPPSPDPDAGPARRRPKPMSYGATELNGVPSLHVQIATPEPSHYERANGENGENGNGYGFSGFDDDDIDDMEDVGGESRAERQHRHTRRPLTRRVVALHEQVLHPRTGHHIALLRVPHSARHMGMVSLNLLIS